MIALLRRRLSGDHGAAMVAVLGILMVLSVVSVTLVGSTIYSSKTSATSRTGVQAQNTAEMAIDLTLEQLNTTAYRGSEASFPCTVSSSYTTDSGTIDVDLEIGYEVGGSGTFACPIANGSEVTGAEVTARSRGAVFGADVPRVVRQRHEVVPTTGGTPLFGYGVFSGEGLSTTNTFEVIDGGVHTNGDYTCNSQARVEGPVTALGSANFTNSCYMQGLWVGGTVACTSQSVIDGDVIAAGTGGSSFTNNCTVTGNAVLGGSVTGSGWSPYAPTFAKNVFGDLISATGSINMQASARIGGNALAAGTIKLNNGNPVTSAHVAGSIRPSTPSAVPAPPPAQEMPAIYWADVKDIGTSPAVDFKQWVKDNAIANGAPTWNSTVQGTSCTAAGPSWSMNGPLRSPGEPTVVDARDCDVTFQDLTLELNDDLTLVVKSFTGTNTLNVISHKPGPERAKLRIIVPMPDGTAACTPAAKKGSISFQGGGTNLGGPTGSTQVDVFLYSNNKVTLTNLVTMNGSIYGCTTSFSVASKITYADMTPPGMTNPGGVLYEFIPKVRYDLDADA